MTSTISRFLFSGKRNLRVEPSVPASGARSGALRGGGGRLRAVRTDREQCVTVRSTFWYP
jgi:hypothetical protein